MTIDAHAFSLAIRWLHVAAMAVAFGGAVLLAAATRTRGRTSFEGTLDFAAMYERAFWSAAGILVMTGVGNAAAFGAQLSLPESGWGQVFAAKLVTIAALLFLSVPRTLAVVHFDARAERGQADSTLARLYAATALGLVAILAIAVWLAHG